MTTYLREEDVTELKDGGIIKKVIREGSGDHPRNGQKVIGMMSTKTHAHKERERERE